MAPGRLMRAACTMPGTAVLIGSAAAVCVGLEMLCRGASGRRSGRIPKHATFRQDYFRIGRVMDRQGKAFWMLRGFGRYECVLPFESWAEAMNQARYHIETLSTGETELRAATDLL